MPDVLPFQAIRYSTRGGSDLTGRIAPPYDVLGAADKEAMLAADPHNIVAIDLPHMPPKSLGPADAYRRSADLLRQWLADGVLVRDDAPAIYAYQQTFAASDGSTVTRRGFIARVRIEEFRATPAGIYPHEQTFGGPKEDRLALTRATAAQLSPIFGLFADEGNAITDLLYAGLSDPPLMTGTIGGVAHAAWRVADAGKVAALTAAMASRPVFIADGHHRYTTALNHMNELAAAGRLGPDDPARFCMFVCISMDDPGLVIWPTHRVVTVAPFDLDELAKRLKPIFTVDRTGVEARMLETQVLANGPGWFALRTSRAADPGLLLELKDRKVLDRLEPARGQAWRRLDVALLHSYLIDELLTPLAGAPAAIEYPHTGADAAAALGRGLDAATSFGTAGESAGGGERIKLAILTAPAPLASVRDVCLSGELMPQKSTYFYPKLATGLTIYPHA
ncbi:MAG: hypothetical protein BIFFINMI_02866 [Phycisphaerae bacterium]|nr:hypothetical protein [Phycisphaerae bacterium]